MDHTPECHSLRIRAREQRMGSLSAQVTDTEIHIGALGIAGTQTLCRESPYISLRSLEIWFRAPVGAERP